MSMILSMGDTLEKVEAYLAGHPDEKALKPIYEYFDSKISYGALRVHEYSIPAVAQRQVRLVPA